MADDGVQPRLPGESTIPGDAVSTAGFVLDPQKLLRIAGVTREVLEEARRIRPEAGVLGHLRSVHGQITDELRQSLPEALFQELDKLTPDVQDGTLEELALAHAEILGWLEGLFQGTQLAIQVQAAQALQHIRRPGLPSPEDPREPEPDSRYL
jgi:Bacterial proteasome activator